MAKRHSHYKARGTGRTSGGRKHNTKAKTGTKRQQKPKNNGNVRAVGGGDLSNLDMMDDYYFGKGYGGSSMRMGGMRPGRQHEGEGDETAKHIPPRKRPVEFIKAKEVFDPSHELILRLQAANMTSKAADSTGVITEVTEPAQEVPEVVGVEIAEAAQVAAEDVRVLIVDEKRQESERRGEGVVQIEDIPDEELFFVDEKPASRKQKVKTVNIDPPVRPSHPRATEFEPELTIGKTLLNLQEDDNGCVSVQLPKWKSHSFKVGDDYLDQFSDSGESEEVIEDEELGNGSDFSVIEESDEDFAEESFENSAESRQSPVLSANIESLSLDDTAGAPSKSSEDYPEFGFLEEDFAVNVSEATVTNIRIGAHENSYYLSSYRYFGDYEPRWVDQDDLIEFVGELGLPEHRVDAYLDFVMDSVVPKIEKEDALEKKIAREVAVVDSSSDSESDRNDELEYSGDEDLGENLEDLVAYSTKYEAVRNQTYDTKSIQTSGRGLKKKLLFDEQLQLDQSMKEELQGKLSHRQTNKAHKRLTKHEFIAEQNSQSEDLFLKYPFGFHVQNIKDEFESFLGRNKPSMSFPPLDPQGNRTLMNFAQASLLYEGQKSREEWQDLRCGGESKKDKVEPAQLQLRRSATKPEAYFHANRRAETA